MTHANMLAARLIRRAPVSRKSLMMSCASFALAAAALHPQAARAQAFQGNIASSTGSVTRVTPTPTTETITIGSNTATINWTPTEVCCGRIDFLPNGNTATFTSAPGITDYTVLNRIVPVLDPTRGISLNGHVISTLQGTSATGGRIWFYSPGGILIGSTAVFDVGSLLLTTNDLTSSSPAFSTFTGPAGSTSVIQVQNGAQINALQPGSYVAMIAPRIEQGGKVRVNGSAAYVAAEGATMSINQGLFDIQVDVGTTDANGIVHTGETSGPANSAATDNHGIYMVAVPKNQALEMLLGGTVGFDNAVSAQVQNGQIILSAGYGTSGPNFQQASLGGAIAGTPADMTISGGNFTSSVTAAATGNIEANGGGGTLAFTGDVTLQGLQSASLVAHDGDTITVGGNARISADDLRTFTTSDSEVGIDAVGGDAAIQAQSGGSIQIAGSARVTADAGSAVNNTSATSGSTQGGYASISAPGGSIVIGGAASVSASGLGAVSSGPVSHGGDSFGQSASLSASNGGSVTIGGTLDVRADGTGSSTTICCGSGGLGEGGSAGISADDGGAITVHGAAVISASGQGGAVLASPDGLGGDGDGSYAYLGATFGGSISFGSTAQLFANGTGGNALLQGGDGYGGTAASFIDGGSITAAGELRLRSYGLGGMGLTGGDGFGGEAMLEFTGGEGEGAGGSLTVGGQTVLEGFGTGGAGLDNAEGTGGQGGDGYGGSAWFYVSPYQSAESTLALNLHDTILTSNANGGAGGNGLTGGNGGSAFSNFFGEGEGGFFGGTSTFELYAGTGTIGNLDVFSTSRGGNGGAGSNGVGGDGGDAFGGGSNIIVGGDLNATRALSYDRAFAGNGGSGATQGDGGYAQGGSASIDIVDGGHFTGNIDIATTAFGGSGNTGGDADSGFGSLDVEGTLSAGSILMDGNAFGGAGVVQGGDARGHQVSIDVFGGSANVSNEAILNVDATGGNASNGSGGTAIGGQIFVEAANGGTLTGGNLSATANATGGNGNSAGLGGGGHIDITSDNFGEDAATSISLNRIILSANGTLGTGATDDETFAYGGSVGLSAFGGSLSANTLIAQANGTNLGGSIRLNSDVEFGGAKGNLSFGTLTGVANGSDLGGFIFVGAGGGSIIDLGDATLTATGADSGQIMLSAGSGFGCACEGEAPGQSAALPAGGGITANNVTLNTSGNILMSLSGGADISVAGTLAGNADGIISMFDDGSGGAIRAHIIDLSALTIVDNADIIADIIRFTSRSDMTLGTLSATDRIDLDSAGDLTTGDLAAGTVHLRSDGDMRFGNLTGDHTDFDAHGSVTGGDIHVTTRADGSADGAILLGNITAGPNVPTGNEFSVGISSGTSITVGNVTGAGHVGFATPGNLTTGNLTAGDLVMLLVGHDISTGSITTAANGRVYVGDASMFLLGGGDEEGNGDFDPIVVLALAPVRTHGLIAINGPVSTGKMQAAAGGNITVGAITAPNGLSLDSGGNISAGNLTSQTVALTAAGNTTVHDVNAAGSAAFSAGGLATFNGTVRSPTITVVSGDIDIAAGASLGVQGVTNLLTLNAVSHGLPILLGDGGPANPGAPGQYHLNEDGDIHSAAVVINALSASPGQNPDVRIFDSQIGEGGNGPDSITLNTLGSIFVEGDLHYLNAAPTASLTLNAGHVLEVNTDTGSIVITDSTGHLTGTLALNADNVWIGSGSLLHQLEADPNFAGRDAALGAAPGTPNQDGLVRAGTITSQVVNSFFAQNSGTATLFAGIDTGAGGLSITSAGATPATLIIYGRQTNADGTVITNNDFLNSVNLQGTVGFTNDSAVNGCTIGSTCGQDKLTPGIDMASILGPLDETNSPDDQDKKDKDQGEEGDDGSGADPSLRLINTTPINLDHQIDDPVTSGGDVVIGGGAVSPY